MTRRLLNFDSRIQENPAFQGLGAGVDEVGRGPLAGPVVAAAVILYKKIKLPGLDDSKQVAPKERERLYWLILKNALVGIGIASEQEIDTLNIYHAGLLAMKRAVQALAHTPDYLLIDGNARIRIPLTQETIVQGDAKSASIAAASIMAKVYRDRLMNHLDTLYPGYAFNEHKGYATELHLELLQKKGPCPIHRRSFAAVRAFFEPTLI